MSYKTRRVRFSSAAGTELVGRLESPVGAPVGRVLFAHCFTCSKDLKPLVRISRTLAQHGFLVLRFDFTGIGESEGDFAETSFSSNLDDLVAAAEFFGHEFGPVDLLAGHSLGGAAVLAAAERIPEARAIATIAAPSSTGHLRETLLARAPELGASELAEVDLGGRKVRLGRELLEDLRGKHVSAGVETLDRPLLVLHSPSDSVVDMSHAQTIYAMAGHPKSLIALDEADHLLLQREDDARFVGDVMAAWAKRYSRGRAAEPEPAEAGERAARRASGLAPREIVVEGEAAGFVNQVYAGRHRLVADEPEEVGGTDTGPNPYDLLLAALGACKSMTLRMYADRKGWPLEGVRARLRHQKIHAKDCEECESENGRVDRIDVDLEIRGPLDDEQRRRLLEISERCPVHKTLTSETSIRSRLASVGDEASS